MLKPKDFSTILGADGGTWTPTSLRTLAPEASASAIPPHPHAVFTSALKGNGASDGTWTRTSFDTRPSNVPVYQFQHTRISNCQRVASLSATRIIISASSAFVNTIFRFSQKIFETGLRAEFSPSLPVSPAALYAPNRICKRSLSAIIEINSLFVGLPLTPETV